MKNLNKKEFVEIVKHYDNSKSSYKKFFYNLFRLNNILNINILLILLIFFLINRYLSIKSGFSFNESIDSKNFYTFLERPFLVESSIEKNETFIKNSEQKLDQKLEIQTDTEQKHKKNSETIKKMFI